MADFDTIKNALYDFVYDNSGNITVRWSNENAPESDKLYFSLLITNFVQLGWEDYTPPDINGNADILIHNDFTFMIRGFGQDIIEKTKLVRASLARHSVQETLRSNGIAIVDPLPVLDITGVTNDSTYEERSSCDIILRENVTLENEDVGIIETVSGEGTYKSPGRPDIVESFLIQS